MLLELRSASTFLQHHLLLTFWSLLLRFNVPVLKWAQIYVSCLDSTSPLCILLPIIMLAHFWAISALDNLWLSPWRRVVRVLTISSLHTSLNRPANLIFSQRVHCIWNCIILNHFVILIRCCLFYCSNVCGLLSLKLVRVACHRIQTFWIWIDLLVWREDLIRSGCHDQMSCHFLSIFAILDIFWTFWRWSGCWRFHGSYGSLGAFQRILRLEKIVASIDRLEGYI